MPTRSECRPVGHQIDDTIFVEVTVDPVGVTGPVIPDNVDFVAICARLLLPIDRVIPSIPQGPRRVVVKDRLAMASTALDVG